MRRSGKQRRADARAKQRAARGKPPSVRKGKGKGIIGAIARWNPVSVAYRAGRGIVRGVAGDDD